MSQLEIGCTPCDEKCEQLGPKYNREKAIAECRAYINQMKRVYGEPPAGARFKVTSNNHEFGTYHEVAIVFYDEEGADYAYRCETGCEHWDTEAIKELGDYYKSDSPRSSSEDVERAEGRAGWDPTP